MRKEDTFQIVLLSIFTSIILLMTFVPQLGYITILPGVALTLVHIPTLIGIVILKPKYAISLGFVFGISSLIASFIMASTPFELAFRNPLISILPRVLFAIVALFLFKGLTSLSKLKNGNIIIFAIVSVIAVLAIYFGSVAIVKNAVFNDYNNAIEQNKDWEEQDPLIRDILPPFSDQEIDELRSNANELERNVLNIVIPIVLVLSALFITLFYALIVKGDYKSLVIPSTFLISTICHTILVMAAVVIFSSDFAMAFSDAVSLIYSIALSNGLIESLAAVMIGTPIYFAVSNINNKVAVRA